MKIEIAALSATAHAAMTQGSVFGFGQGTFKFDTSGAFQKGHSTHYGPFPSLPEMNEVGYLKNDVGVGCSNGQPGGDPRWLEILKEGVMVNPLDPTTVWPNKPTVAVSQAAWSKQAVCFKTMTIRNAKIPAYSIEAVIVDFCPSQGCLWDKRMRHLNADIYGEATWKKLGANLTDGVIEIEIKWPEGIRPYSSKGIRSRSLESLIYFALIVIFVI